MNGTLYGICQWNIGIGKSMELRDCTLCPRDCHVDRTAGQTGYCGQTSKIKAARAALHMWEEPCISGQTGSGTVFFSGCNMGCVFCQNYGISRGMSGKEISSDRLSQIFLELQEKNACNINLVTPTHFVPQIAAALEKAKEDGLKLPVVYNTSSYEKVETLKLLDGLVDVYLPDFKYFSSVLSRKYSFAEDYFTFAGAALEEMVRQAGKAVFAPQNSVINNYNREEDALGLGDDYMGALIQKGVIVRHLVLPGCEADSRKVLRYLHDTYQNDIYVSIMNQYTPISRYLEKEKYSELNRTLTGEEYDRVVDFAIDIGIENGFIQEGGACSESFIPDFDCTGI